MVSNPRMSSSQSILVTVLPKYLEEQSVPESSQYVFAYTVYMENRGNVAAQLLTRHWIISDSNGKIEEVRGSGVVGEHPHLDPGDSFQYTSGTVLKTPFGTMRGSYRMRDANGNLFDAVIPAFTLTTEEQIH